MIAYHLRLLGLLAAPGDSHGLPVLDRQAQAFAQGLQQLQQIQAGGEAQHLLQKIERKWRYIEPSLRHYQQDTIPTRVNRYSSRIIEDLALLPSLVQAAQ